MDLMDLMDLMDAVSLPSLPASQQGKQSAVGDQARRLASKGSGLKRRVGFAMRLSGARWVK